MSEGIKGSIKTYMPSEPIGRWQDFPRRYTASGIPISEYTAFLLYAPIRSLIQVFRDRNLPTQPHNGEQG